MPDSEDSAVERPANVRNLRAMFEGGVSNDLRSPPAHRTSLEQEPATKSEPEQKEQPTPRDRSNSPQTSTNLSPVKPELDLCMRQAKPEVKTKPQIKPKPNLKPKPTVKPKPTLTWPPPTDSVSLKSGVPTKTPDNVDTEGGIRIESDGTAESNVPLSLRERESGSPNKGDDPSGANVAQTIPAGPAKTEKPSLPIRSQSETSSSCATQAPPVRRPDTANDRTGPKEEGSDRANVVSDLIDFGQKDQDEETTATESTFKAQRRPPPVVPRSKPSGAGGKPELPLRSAELNKEADGLVASPSSSRSVSPTPKNSSSRVSPSTTDTARVPTPPASTTEHGRRTAPNVPVRAMRGSSAAVPSASRYLACFDAVVDPTSEPPVVRPAAVRAVWTRSKLAAADLAEIWRSVSGGDAACAGLTQTQFVTGLGMIDAQLRVRRRAPAASAAAAPPQLPQRPVES